MSSFGSILGWYMQERAAKSYAATAATYALQAARQARVDAAYEYARNWLRGKAMTTEKKHEGLPVAGYKSQSEANVAKVNKFKRMEEQILRELDSMKSDTGSIYDQRWLAIGRTQLEQAFMAINRSVFQPGRIEL